VDSAVNTLFSEISPGKLNSEILAETLVIDKLREEVVRRLTQIEKLDLGFWWQDKDLMEMFNSVFKSGCIILPKDPVERLRWIALLCVEMSNTEGFDCGNIVIPLDFLPLEMMVLFEDLYGVDVLESVIEIREKVAEQGWGAVFGS